jgi:hypothetical protein
MHACSAGPKGRLACGSPHSHLTEHNHTCGELELAFHSRSNRELPDIRSGLPCSGARVKTSSTTTPGTPSEPPPSRDSRSICDGWRPKPRHDRRPRVPAHRLRVRTSPPNRSNCPRWRASEHCSARLLTRIPKQVRATLGDALWADFVALASACYEVAFLSAFPKPVLCCVGLPNGGTCPHNFAST